MGQVINYEISDEQSKRLNILKLLFAVFVVLIHSGVKDINLTTGYQEFEFPIWFEYYSYFFSEVIPRCAVSGFFFISSLLLYRKDFSWQDNIKKRFKTIVIPYLLLNIFWIIIFAIFQAVPQTQVFFAKEDNIVRNFDFLRWLAAFGIGSQYPFLRQLWFLRNLFVLNLLSIVIKKVIDFAPRLSIVLVGVIFFFSSSFPYHDFYYCLQPLDLCVWCLGYFVVKYRVNIDKYDYNKWLLVAFIITCIYRMATMNVQVSWIAPYRICIVVSLMFWYAWFSKNTNGKIQKLFLKLSPYNFGIYVFHQYNLLFIKKIIVKLFGARIGVLIVEYLILPFLICTLVIILCDILKKFTPRLYAVLMGSRV